MPHDIDEWNKFPAAKQVALNQQHYQAAGCLRMVTLYDKDLMTLDAHEDATGFLVPVDRIEMIEGGFGHSSDFVSGHVAVREESGDPRSVKVYYRHGNEVRQAWATHGDFGSMLVIANYLY